MTAKKPIEKMARLSDRIANDAPRIKSIIICIVSGIERNDVTILLDKILFIVEFALLVLRDTRNSKSIESSIHISIKTTPTRYCIEDWAPSKLVSSVSI